MSRVRQGVELGFNLFEENGDSPVAAILITNTAPIGTGDQGDAPIGSLLVRYDNGTLYQKTANAGAPADWALNGTASAVIGKWRNETVSVVTNDTQGVGVRDVVASPFSDDSGAVLVPADFIIGEHIISDADGTPALLRISAKSGVGDKDITFVAATTALVAEDTFICKFYLPDPDGGENRALVNYNGTVVVKISDIDWQFLTGINLSSGYTPGTGNPIAGDTGEDAIQKIDGNVDQLTAAVGIAQGAANMGTYTGVTISDNQTAKQNIQQLETALEALQTKVGPANIAQSTPTVVDSVLVDVCQRVSWEVVAHDQGDPTAVQTFVISAFHNGHAGADATSVRDDITNKKKLGANFNFSASVTLTGSAGTQAINLVLNTTDANGIRYSIRRLNYVNAL